jgi:hypothetical protein
MDSHRQRLKTHSRTLDLDGLSYTILSPRPTVEARFATNQNHATWHVITDPNGAQLLARLCWAMAFQRHARTIAVIDQSFLVPDPFEGDPSLPVVIVNSDLGPLRRGAVTALRHALPLTGPSNGTVVLQTRGLDVALADVDAFAVSDDQSPWRDPQQRPRWIEESDGVLVIAAPPPVLRSRGVELSQPERWSRGGNNSTELNDHGHEAEVQVQVLEEFTNLVETAMAARVDD